MTDSVRLTEADYLVLKGPVPRDTLGIKVQSMNKERTKAMLVLYLQHTDVYDRLEKVDPNWESQILHQERVGDTVFVRMKMVLKGVSRENVGDGNDAKSATSDALKRVAMLFGVGRYLYDSETVWVDYNEKTDRYRKWTVADYDAAARRMRVEPAATEENSGQTPELPKPQAPVTRPAVTPRVKLPTPQALAQGANDGIDPPKVQKAATTSTRDEIAKQIKTEVYRLGFDPKVFAAEITDEFKKTPERLSRDEMHLILSRLQGVRKGP